MSLIKALYISVFMFFEPLVEAGIVRSEQCDKLVLKANVILVDEKGTKVEIEAVGGKTPYKYVFYKESGHLISTEYDRNWVEGLQKGKYACTVADKNNCKKTIDFEIK